MPHRGKRSGIMEESPSRSLPSGVFLQSLFYRGHMSSKKRLLLIDDHAILRDGLRNIFDDNPEFEVVAEAGNATEALAQCEAVAPDIVLLDLTLPKEDGINLLREIKRRWPNILVLVFTMHNHQKYLEDAMVAGADGYCLKDTSIEELYNALHLVSWGKKYISEELLRGTHADFCDFRKEKAGWEKAAGLTGRELEVIRLVAQGLTNAQIAETLSISERTVDNHCSSIRLKLDVHSKQGITAFAFRTGLLN